MVEQEGGGGGSGGISEEEAAQYDRQIRLWGLEAQRRLRASRVLLVGMKGLGAEVAKNPHLGRRQRPDHARPSAGIAGGHESSVPDSRGLAGPQQSRSLFGTGSEPQPHGRRKS
ncbi:unnamed protein product [Natator depressus]